jgi:2-phosphoglycerate kinase
MNPIDFSRLKSAHLFAGLSLQELETVAARGALRRLRKHTVFIQYDDTSSSLYLILSGKVKVYLVDSQGNEQLLGVRGPGEHLGELSLLTDGVRTASAATLEDADVLVLSRRGFVECLSDCPQIALNLDHSLEERALSPGIGEKVAPEYRAWSRFRHSGLPLVILVGGSTGTGKSTLAAELALRLDIGRTQSTDILRDVVRLFVSKQFAPELHVSSYDAWRVLPCRESGERSQGLHLIEGFGAQSDRLAATIDAVIRRSVKERVSIIVEGIQIVPAYHRRVMQTEAVVVPLLLTIPASEKLKQHFCRRGEIAPSRGAVQYLENFSAIWQIQDFLIEEAQRCRVPVIPNMDLDETVRRAIGVITQQLVKHFP